MTIEKHRKIKIGEGMMKLSYKNGSHMYYYDPNFTTKMLKDILAKLEK